MISPIIKIHKSLINFRKPYLRTPEGKQAQKDGEYYKRIKESMERVGMINPLVCTKEGDEYIICLGHKRYLIGCDLGMQEFPVFVVPNDDKLLLRKIQAEFEPTDADNAYYEYIKSKSSESNIH